MKLFDKVKNMFTEEVEEEVQVEQVKTSKKKKNNVETIDQIKEEKRLEEEKKPVFFTDDDFNDMDLYRREEKSKKKEKEVKIEPKPKYQEDSFERYEQSETLPKRSSEPYEEVKTPKKFKPTPIISPVYGILDKNYHKEDIVNKTDTDYNSVDGLSVDSIRNKAYGTLEDELENTLFGNNSILFNNKEDSKDEKSSNDDILDDIVDEEMNKDIESIDKDLDDLENITMDIGKELDSLLSKNNDETNEEDLFDLIDNMYEGDEEDDN